MLMEAAHTLSDERESHGPTGPDVPDPVQEEEA
jgi:hypothetical protein